MKITVASGTINLHYMQSSSVLMNRQIAYYFILCNQWIGMLLVNELAWPGYSSVRKSLMVTKGKELIIPRSKE